MDRRRATLWTYRARLAALLSMENWRWTTQLPASPLVDYDCTRLNETVHEASSTVLVHGTRTIPSVRLSPGRIMNRWVLSRALLATALGSGQCACRHARKLKAPWALGSGPAAITGSPPARSSADRR
jgi:hypothetical protein